MCQLDIRLLKKMGKVSPHFEKCWCSVLTLCGEWVETMHCKKSDWTVLIL
jgi:hypothetical protein